MPRVVSAGVPGRHKQVTGYVSLHMKAIGREALLK